MSWREFDHFDKKYRVTVVDGSPVFEQSVRAAWVAPPAERRFLNHSALVRTARRAGLLREAYSLIEEKS